MAGGDSDSDSDDNSNGVVEVAAGTVPTSAAAAILNSNPTVATPIPAAISAPVPASAPAIVQINQSTPASRTPITSNAPPSSRPLASSAQPPHGSAIHSVTNLNRVRAPNHPSTSSTSSSIQRTVVSTVNNPVAGVGVGATTPNSQSSSAHQVQNKLLYGSRSAVPPISSHPTAAQHKQYQHQQHIRKPYQTTVSSNPPSVSSPAPVSHPHDAFEPTPLKDIKAKTKNISSSAVLSQQRNNLQMQHMMSRQTALPVQRNPQHNRQHPFRSTTNVATTPTSRARTSPAPSSSQQQQQQRQQSQTSQTSSASSHDQKSRKERFLMFTRVLMKYLEQKDRDMHAKAKEVIRQCAKKNKEGDPNYVSLSASMQSHLKNLVGDIYWKKAEEYLRQYLFGQYSKDGMAHKDAKKKADEVAKSAAEPLPANTPIYAPASMRQTSKSQGTTQAWPGAQQQHKATHSQTQAQVQAQAQAQAVKATAQKKKRQEANKKKKADAAAAAAAQANAAKTSQTVVTTTKTGGTQANASGMSNTTGGKTTKGKKTSNASRKTSATNATATVPPTQVREPKEYEELMEMLDHAVDYDVTSCIKILGNGSLNKQKNEVNISEEQMKLLYHDFGMSGGPRKGLYGGLKVEDSNLSNSSLSQRSTTKLPPYLEGWGTRNIVSSRSAWAKLRLVEEEVQKLAETPLPPVTHSSNVSHKGITTEESDSNEDTDMMLFNYRGADGWLNEEMAEQDEALTLISEATQQFVRTILEGAMNTASKRLNLDGIRLWHQQHTALDAVAKEVQLNGEKLSQKSTIGPPLCIRLGCDVNRQFAMVQGNAARTSQRMEEALSRKSNYKSLDNETMRAATNMTELSKMPQVSSAARNAEFNAKRSFEIYGGKDSGNPPLGRVPKQAKILVKDFKFCLSESTFAMSKNRVSTFAFV